MPPPPPPLPRPASTPRAQSGGAGAQLRMRGSRPRRRGRGRGRRGGGWAPTRGHRRGGRSARPTGCQRSPRAAAASTGDPTGRVGRSLATRSRRPSFGPMRHPWWSLLPPPPPRPPPLVPLWSTAFLSAAWGEGGGRGGGKAKRVLRPPPRFCTSANVETPTLQHLHPSSPRPSLAGGRIPTTRLRSRLLRRLRRPHPGATAAMVASWFGPAPDGVLQMHDPACHADTAACQPPLPHGPVRPGAPATARKFPKGRILRTPIPAAAILGVSTNGGVRGIRTKRRGTPRQSNGRRARLPGDARVQRVGPRHQMVQQTARASSAAEAGRTDGRSVQRLFAEQTPNRWPF